MPREKKAEHRYRRWAYYLAKRSRETDGFDSITEEEVLDLFDHQDGLCYWTKLGMIVSPYRKYPWQPSLDRLDHSKPHTIDNVVLCCLAINMGRKDTNVIVWKNFISSLKKVFQNEINQSVSERSARKCKV